MTETSTTDIWLHSFKSRKIDEIELSVKSARHRKEALLLQLISS